MRKIDYSCPLPEKSLIDRFSNVFKKINDHQSATLLALPYSGRTSNLRFIVNNKKILEKLNFDINNKLIYLIDIDKAGDSYESFISIIIETIVNRKIASKIQNDTYLLSKQLLEIIGSKTTNAELVLIITLNNKIINFSSDFDRLITIAQKSTTKFPLTILWSIDTNVYRNYHKSHPSSTFGQNIFFFKTFDPTETNHSIKRILLTNSHKHISSVYFEKTAGIAGLFHTAVNFDTNYFEQFFVQDVLKKIKSEIENNLEHQHCLIYPDVRKIIDEHLINSASYQSIKLLNNPTGQEIKLIDCFIRNKNKPTTRDEIAQNIWGKSWNTKYSDWAIDKAISRLRTKIVSRNMMIITIKNLGYQLVEHI